MEIGFLMINSIHLLHQESLGMTPNATFTCVCIVWKKPTREILDSLYRFGYSQTVSVVEDVTDCRDVFHDAVYLLVCSS